jgi:hypothetical protein
MFNPGDIVCANVSGGVIEKVVIITKMAEGDPLRANMYTVRDLRQKLHYVYEDNLYPTSPLAPKQYTANQKEHKKPDGGPADYYDIPYKAHTLNDLLEYKGEYHWRGDSFHLANLVKAAWRWGVKQGTTESYDARKFIYSGARLLMKYAGVKELRDTLQRMLDDPQFKEDDK